MKTNEVRTRGSLLGKHLGGQPVWLREFKSLKQDRWCIKLEKAMERHWDSLTVFILKE